MNYLYAFLFTIFISTWNINAQENIDTVTKVACIGNSITYGTGIVNKDRDSYPAVLGQILGKEYEVRNFGLHGRSMLNKGGSPYMKEKAYKEALAYNPDIVIIKLGTNDASPACWKFKKEFPVDMETMIDAFLALSSKPQIYLCYPTKIYLERWANIDAYIDSDIIPMIGKVAKKKGLPVINLRKVTEGHPELFPDGIHPNEDGAALMAINIYEAIIGKPASTHIRQSFPGIKSEWGGCERYDFIFDGRQAIVVKPDVVANGKPWIWRPAFFGAFASVDKALLKEGFHIVYYDLTHDYGSPDSQELGLKFYENMTSMYDLSPKVTLEGFSRGGLFAVNWASNNTDKVSCIYLDAPVCDVFSWPGKYSEYWGDLLKCWNMTDDKMDASFSGNPINRVNPLVKAGIPIISVCGDSDKTVPYDKNMEVFKMRYEALGGNIKVILKEGVDHHPHSLDNPEVIVKFILENQAKN